MRPLKPATTSTPAPDHAPVVKPKACVPCRTRKVKCDRRAPCANCCRWEIKCVFPSPIRTCRRDKRRPSVSETAELESNSEDVPYHDVINALLSLHQDAGDKGLLSGQRDKVLAVCGQLEEITRALRQAVGEDASTPRFKSSRSGFDHVSTVTGPLRSSIDLFEINSHILQPLPETVKLCWLTFSCKIDPLIKVLHRRTTEAILKKAILEPHTLTVGGRIVSFGVYVAAISSMSPDKVQTMLGLSKQSALTTYKGALQDALLRANIAATDDVVSLQGFVLSLSLDRFSDDPRRTWALSALSERLTSSLHTRTPLEQELRRRLVYELWYMDYRAYADLGHVSRPPSLEALPSAPSNVNDAHLHLYPSTIRPESQVGWTDVSFALVQGDVARTAVHLESMTSLEHKEAAIDACEARIHTLYLPFCDGSQPIHWLARHVAHVLVMELRFKTYCCPLLWAGEHTQKRELLFVAAVDILDTQRRVAMEPEATQWAWLLEAYMQFWPLRFALQEMCHGWRPGMDMAWGIAGRVLRRWEGGRISAENYGICRQLWRCAMERRSAAWGRGSIGEEIGIGSAGYGVVFEGWPTGDVGATGATRDEGALFDASLVDGQRDGVDADVIHDEYHLVLTNLENSFEVGHWNPVPGPL